MFSSFKNDLSKLNAAMAVVNYEAMRGHRKETLVLSFLTDQEEWLVNTPSPYVCCLGIAFATDILTDPSEILDPSVHNERALALLEVAGRRLIDIVDDDITTINTNNINNLVNQLKIVAERLGEDDIFILLEAVGNDMALIFEIQGR